MRQHQILARMAGETEPETLEVVIPSVVSSATKGTGNRSPRSLPSDNAALAMLLEKRPVSTRHHPVGSPRCSHPKNMRSDGQLIIATFGGIFRPIKSLPPASSRVRSSST